MPDHVPGKLDIAAHTSDVFGELPDCGISEWVEGMVVEMALFWPKLRLAIADTTMSYLVRDQPNAAEPHATDAVCDVTSLRRSEIKNLVPA